MSFPKFLSPRAEVLALLWVAFFFNQADRAMFGFVMPLIKADLQLSDVQLGLVASTFFALYGLLAPVAGYVGDIVRRHHIIITSITVWSLATVLTGLSSGLLHLIIFRGASLALGEAFYVPSADPLIGQYFKKDRAFALSIHQTALYCGMIGSGAIAGFLGARFGWRSAFLVFGCLGLLWAGVMLFRLREPGTETATTPPPRVRIPLREAVATVVGRKSVLMLCLVFGCLVFMNVGYVTWMPTLLHEKFGLTLAQAGFTSMFYHVVCAIGGVMIGGKLSDFMARRRVGGRLLVEGGGMLMCAPCIFLMGTSESLVPCVVGAAGYGLFRGLCDSTLFAAVFDVMENKYRSSAMGLVISCGLLIGAISPVLLGWVKTHYGLSNGILVLSGAAVLGAAATAVTFLFYFKRDYVEPVVGGTAAAVA